MSNPSKKYDTYAHVEGQIMALAAILRGMLLVFPERDDALQQVQAQLEYLRTAALPSRAPDEMLEGIDRIANEVLRPPF